jgi:hypothetical protein
MLTVVATVKPSDPGIAAGAAAARVATAVRVATAATEATATATAVVVGAIVHAVGDAGVALKKRSMLNSSPVDVAKSVTADRSAAISCACTYAMT